MAYAWQLRLLTSLVARDKEQVWLRIASAFFDETGNRIDPKLIEEKFT